MEELNELIQSLVDFFIRADKEFKDSIVKELTVKYPSDNIQVKSMTDLLSIVTKQSKSLKYITKDKVDMIISRAYKLGTEKANFELKSNEQEYNDKQVQNVKSLSEETYNDIISAIRLMDRSAKHFIRIKTSEVMQLKQAVNNGNKMLAYSISRGLTESKLKKDAHRNYTAIVDKEERKWNLKTYVEVVIRTKVLQAYNYGTADESKKQGVHLFKISKHPVCVDECKQWEGKIITVGENIEGYHDFFEIAKTKECFHPYCKHTITPITGGNPVKPDPKYME